MVICFPVTLMDHMGHGSCIQCMNIYPIDMDDLEDTKDPPLENELKGQELGGHSRPQHLENPSPWQLIIRASLMDQVSAKYEPKPEKL